MYIKTIPGKGRGVYASTPIKKGALIERCELIVISKNERPHVKKTIIDHYYYEWNGGRTVIVLGNGSLFNHSFDPSARYTHDYKKRNMVYKALRDIKKDEEITVNYNGDPKDQSKSLVWFPVIDQETKKRKR